MSVMRSEENICLSKAVSTSHSLNVKQNMILNRHNLSLPFFFIFNLLSKLLVILTGLWSTLNCFHMKCAIAYKTPSPFSVFLLCARLRKNDVFVMWSGETICLSKRLHRPSGDAVNTHTGDTSHTLTSYSAYHCTAVFLALPLLPWPQRNKKRITVIK